MKLKIPVEKYSKRCDLKEIGRNSSAEVDALQTIIGQERAVRALHFGLGIKEKGFNVYAAGLPGTGRTTAIENFLSEIVSREPVPADWCYVNDFSDNYRPNALRLPSGKAHEFKLDMESLISLAVEDMRSALDSEMAVNQRDQIKNGFQQRKQDLLEEVSQQAHQEGFGIQATPVGLLVVPMQAGKPIEESAFLALPKEERESLAQKQQQLQAALEAAVRQAKILDKEATEALKKADQEIALYAVKDRFAEMKEKYTNVAEIPEHLDHVQEDILRSLEDFGPQDEAPPSPPVLQAASPKNPRLKYAVNILVDNSALKGAPVILENNPTYGNLFGSIEQEAQFGALVTNFTMIRSGSLHRANGGYLVLPVEEVLRNPLSWESLKRALVNREIVIESPGDKLGFVVTKSLRPEPVPLNVKVILVGRPDIYQLLLAYDEHFNELFKVKADFDIQMPRNPKNIQNYMAFVSHLCQQENLRHMDASAIARVVEHGSRIVEDQEKLTTRFGDVADVIREANYYAGLENTKRIQASHIRRAIEERFYRSSLVQERLLELTTRQVIKIDVSGSEVGQVNGLSILMLGDTAIGQPNRITASVGLGREGLIDIEREANLGGPIHTKGMMILAGFLADKFARRKPLSLSARLVFEQSYSGVEGDSASSAELYALLSTLSGLPIQQGIAVTGSVNQKGEVQAIGGVNFKIEGFFELCKAVGFTGQQGVMIPASNVHNLMLKEDVIHAAEQGLFHIWAVRTVMEGIEVLTGVPAGYRSPEESFESDSVFFRADQRLHELAEKMIYYSKS
jgi:lon-related putative ATP-dependent protease